LRERPLIESVREIPHGGDAPWGGVREMPQGEMPPGGDALWGDAPWWRCHMGGKERPMVEMPQGWVRERPMVEMPHSGDATEGDAPGWGEWFPVRDQEIYG